MAYDKLMVYNNALVAYLGEGRLSGLTESRGPRYILDDVWSADIVRLCLEKGSWAFATKAVELIASPSIDPPFGMKYGFEMPSDYVRLVNICVDQYFRSPLNGYTIENGFIYTDLETIYLRYVSNDEDYGSDMTKWTAAFFEYVSCHMAYKACHRIKNSTASRQELLQTLKTMEAEAKGLDAVERPTAFMPHGTWLKARGGGRSNNRG